MRRSNRELGCRCGAYCITLTLCALAIAGSIGMILELERGFGGLVRVSPQAMNYVVDALHAEANNENSGSHTSATLQ
jgi:hypothetical protein